jgi:hypothetical protein
MGKSWNMNSICEYSTLSSNRAETMNATTLPLPFPCISRLDLSMILECKLMNRYCEVYDTTNTPIDPKYPPEDVEFISPRPRQLFDPISRTVKLPGMHPIHSSSSWNVFDHPTMSLDLIPSVPTLVAQAYKSEFFTQDLARKSPDFNIRLMRLYLGRELPTHIQELQPGLRSDLALDVGRYTRLSKALSLEGIARLPRLGEVAFAMGSILAHLHFCVGIDGMDIELVLGGDGDHGLQCYVLDYNQCHRWLVPQPLDHLGTGKLIATEGESLSEGAIRLARRIANCEHYYPKPSQDLYGKFKDGYELTVSSLVGDRQWENACKSVDPDEAFDTDAEAMIAAGEAFLAEYEKVGRETVERKARTESRHAVDAVVG